MKLIINTEKELYWKFIELKSKYKVKTNAELLNVLLGIEEKL